MRLIRNAVWSCVLLTVVAIGCSKPGSEFVGKWVNSTNGLDTLVISRNGDQFQIAGPDNQKINATFKDGTLQIPIVTGTMDLKYVKSSDTLEAPGIMGPPVEYKRGN